MILTVTINPLLERRYSYPQIVQKIENRNGIKTLAAGGKGINVSRQLNYLNTDNIAITFTGGYNGKIYCDVLRDEGIKFTAIKTKDETRDAAVIIDDSAETLTSYFSKNSKVTGHEVEEFKSKLEKMIENCEMVLFAGSSPCTEADSIFPFGIETANKYDKISICDTYGNHLKACLESSPTILHNNISEINKSLGINLDEENSKLEYLNWLYKNGIKQAFLTNGEKAFYAANFDYHFKVEFPKIKTADSTGSGDAFTAGIIHSWHNDLVFEESVKTAAALGILNATKFDVCNIKPGEIGEISNKVKVLPIGKKMKTLDVTPR